MFIFEEISAVRVGDGWMMSHWAAAHKPHRVDSADNEKIRIHHPLDAGLAQSMAHVRKHEEAQQWSYEWIVRMRFDLNITASSNLSAWPIWNTPSEEARGVVMFSKQRGEFVYGFPQDVFAFIPRENAEYVRV
jgi:hypothetical protein